MKAKPKVKKESKPRATRATRATRGQQTAKKAKLSKKSSKGAKIRQKLAMDNTGEKGLDNLMRFAGFPKSLNSFPRRLERLDKALSADKTHNLSPDQRIHWMKLLAFGPQDKGTIHRISELLKASNSQARKAAGRKGLAAQGK